MSYLEVTPSDIAAAGGIVLDAADEVAGLRRGLAGGGDFGGDAVQRTAAGYRELANDWRRAAQQMADAVESLGQALRGAAEVYRETEDGAMRRP